MLVGMELVVLHMQAIWAYFTCGRGARPNKNIKVCCTKPNILALGGTGECREAQCLEYLTPQVGLVNREIRNSR